jgi:hypothetical protein
MQPYVNALVMLIILIGLCSFLSYIPSLILKKRAAENEINVS